VPIGCSKDVRPTSVAQPWLAGIINARRVPVNRDCQAYVLLYSVV